MIFCRLLEELGSGEFATVCKGLLTTDEDGEVNVAVKCSKTALLNQEEKLRFLREAAIMGQFHHSNVVKLFGVVIDQPDNVSCMYSQYNCLTVSTTVIKVLFSY